MATWTTFRQTYARSVGPVGGPFTTTSVGTTTTLVCTALMHTDWPPSRFSRAWLLILDGACAGQQRQLTGGPLDIATGTLEVGTAFSSLIASGVRFEIHTRVPAKNTTDQEGALEAIGEALQRIRVIDMLPMTGVTDQTTYTLDLATYWWLTDERWILATYDPIPTGQTAPVLARHRFRFRMDAESIYLDFTSAPWRTGETGYLEVRRPANSRLKLTALATAAIGSGIVQSITVVAPGYYATTPTVTITGGGGTGAVGTATLSGTGVASIAVSGSMSGYTTVPTVTVSAGTWGDMTSEVANLVGETDEAPASAGVRDVVTVAKWAGYERLEEAGGAALPPEWKELRDRWEVAARKVLSRNAQRTRDEGLPKLMPTWAGTPVRSR